MICHAKITSSVDTFAWDQPYNQFKKIFFLNLWVLVNQLATKFVDISPKVQ